MYEQKAPYLLVKYSNPQSLLIDQKKKKDSDSESTDAGTAVLILQNRPIQKISKTNTDAKKSLHEKY